MNYIIYPNIKQSDFITLKEKLERLGNISLSLMKSSGFHLNRDSSNFDILALDFSCQDTIYYGNICLSYIEDENLNESFFKFGIVKCYDTESCRYYKKQSLNNLFSISQIEEQIIPLLQQCLMIYTSLRQEDLVDVIEFN